MLPTYKSILYTTDLSPNAVNAFKHAIMLARLHDAKIHLLHVVQPVDSATRGYISAVLGDNKLEQFEQKHQQEAQVILKKRLEDFAKAELSASPDDLARVADTLVVLGDPVVKIVELAKQLQVDVIVLGSHSKGALEHAYLGSVAEKVLKKANRPVFIIPLAKI